MSHGSKGDRLRLSRARDDTLPFNQVQVDGKLANVALLLDSVCAGRPQLRDSLPDAVPLPPPKGIHARVVLTFSEGLYFLVIELGVLSLALT